MLNTPSWNHRGGPLDAELRKVIHRTVGRARPFAGRASATWRGGQVVAGAVMDGGCMRVVDPSPSPILVHARAAEDREWFAALAGDLGLTLRDLHTVSDADLASPAATEPILAQTGGPSCPLDRLRAALEAATSARRPLILLAPREGLERVASWAAPQPHAVVLVEPCEAEELASILRASVANESQHREATEELRRTNAELHRLRELAESEARRRSQFLAAISHDLRTPLYEIALVAQIARGQDDATTPIDWDRLAAGLLAGVATLRERVDDLFDLARLDLGAIEPHAEPFLLTPALDRVLAPYKDQAEAKGLTFEVDAPPPWVSFVGDSDKLARLVQNLVSNAVKFTDAGTIRVVARLDPKGGLWLSVSDEGRGIAPESLEAIFDEFAQVGNPERERTKGTGLGLAISRRLAKILGGTITVTSELGAGSEFVLRLPAA